MPDARILVTGSRSWSDAQLLADTLLDTWHDATQLGYTSIVIVHGGADGADTLAAGADLVVGFQRNGSRGTADCLRRAEALGLPVRHITA